ncbi:phage baseplate assembly protein V [Phascolarctobacterium succinatutens]|uniref:phage baseplate assembly protein V n=1 Tax=Phascolarctobacterium succinatutens TaxID=626940 RepID=UPI003077EBBC
MDINQIKNLIRIGTVSAVNGESCSARVAFEDKDNMVSAELPIITIGSKQTKAYWLPEVGTQVLCIFQPNASGSGISKGFIIGAFYSTQDAPVEKNADVRSVTFADGSFIRYQNGNIEINATGKLLLKGATVEIN